METFWYRLSRVVLEMAVKHSSSSPAISALVLRNNAAYRCADYLVGPAYLTQR